MIVEGKVTGTIAADLTVAGTLTTAQEMAAVLTIPNLVLPPRYHGSVTVTPSAERQILQTQDLYMQDNITIEPIPENYGLITWDGSTLTVS